MPQPPADGPRQGLTRRQLTARIAAGAAAVWTAPQILTTAPARADHGSVVGTFRARFDGLIRTDANGGGCVNTSTWNATANYPGSVAVADTGPTVVFTLSEPNCAFDGTGATFTSRARCSGSGNNCRVGVVSSGGQVITFTKASCASGGFNFFQLAIVC